MQIVFRADASTSIGSGHLVRCATLAHALQRRGAKILFACREANGDMTGWLEEQGLAVARLAFGTRDDAAETLSALGQRDFDAADWVVVDHYGLDGRWEQAMSRPGRRVLAIDDLADRSHDCDLFLDQNLVAEHDTRYAGLLPDTAVPLLGPRYAMLQPGYRQVHSSVRARHGRPRGVLVYFGAADLPGLTGRVVAALLRQRDDIVIDMVIGAVNPRRQQLLALARMHPQLIAHFQMPSLVELMKRADLAVGAGGATSWERLCLGLPSLVVTLAANQQPIAAELHRRKLAIWLGDADELDGGRLDDVLRQALEKDAETWFDAAQAGIVDGRGVDRVAAAMLGESSKQLVSRPVSASDEWLLLEWANDPTTRATAFQPQRITADGHHRWLQRRLAESKEFRLFVVETPAGVELGQVRFEREGEDWFISYSLGREFRGQGLAAPMLASALEALHSTVGPAMVAGRVRPENIASRRVFDRLQFTAAHLDDKAIEFRRQI
ncbi:UDP-2,4-diacetamido-2,4,6-trideoxy-beta-L-altropyranose hydrolase [Devosia sp. UYZn731]|uniref:UDP-2,4-diacetamido-2,4, 6-trideoxy-beta-L-altropyranose hydrolase n=1 Tax=Devosia sp. UYZn731 TaxID=3156345 RepID=UPI00339B0E75